MGRGAGASAGAAHATATRGGPPSTARAITTLMGPATVVAGGARETAYRNASPQLTPKAGQANSATAAVV
jgi:hypothetical protein